LGLARLSRGTEIVGATQWNTGVSALTASQDATIDYLGASGTLNFDEKGEAPGDIDGWRFDLEQQSVQGLGTMYTAEGAYFPVAEPEEQ